MIYYQMRGLISPLFFAPNFLVANRGWEYHEICHQKRHLMPRKTISFAIG